MSSAVCKRSSLIAIVNRLYMNANNDQIDEASVGDGESKDEEIKSQSNSPNSNVSSREASESPKNIKTKKPLHSFSTPIIPLSSEIASNGITAIGGCRQCSRTFNDRLSLIHHFVDHFPTIFYSFESVSSLPSSSSSSALPLIPIMPSATTSSASGIPSTSFSNSNISQNSLTKNCGGQQQYASGIQSMMFFPYISMSHNNNNNYQSCHQQQQSQQQPSVKVKEVNSSETTTVVIKKKREPKPKNAQTNENVKETSSRFTDFNKSSNDLPYDMCPHCCQTFSDHSLYSEHLKSHDTPIITLGTPMTSTESPLKCEYCDLRFSNEYLLKEHKKIHCRICSICSKTLMTAFDLNLHMGIHSGFSYDCKDCGRCFPDRKALALHNKMHRSDLSTQDSDEEKHSQKAPTTILSLKENVKKPKIEKPSPPFSVEDKPESFFKNNPYFENIFKQNPRKRRQRLHRNGAISSSSNGGETATENSKKKSKN